jgi:hypothetical protein
LKPAIEIMHERAAEAVRNLVSRVPAGAIRAAFAGGSVGRNEVWSAVEGTTLAIYSDLDLYVVLSDHADENAVRRAAAALVVEIPSGCHGVLFHRGLDVGVYHTDDLLAQPVRPGTIDLAEHHLWLYGDRAIVERLRAAMSGSINAGEALYLLENRSWDALEAVAEAGQSRAPARAAATAAKVVLDVLSAHLIAEGRFRPTHAARYAESAQRAPAQLSREEMGTIARAERFRSGDAASRVEPAVALAMVANAWCVLAPAILSCAHSAPQAPATLLAARCNRGAWSENYREFVRLRHRARLSLPLAAATGWRFAALAPRAALRTHALVRALIESARVADHAVAFHAAYVARMASRLGFHQSTLDERARAALRAVS